MSENRSDIDLHMSKLQKMAELFPVIIEVGVQWGNGSTRAFKNGFGNNKSDDRLFISIDINYEIDDKDKPAFDFWHFILGDSTSEPVLEQTRKLLNDRKANIIFIDSNHTYDQVKKEIEAYKQFGNKDTIWLFHDTYLGGNEHELRKGIIESCPETHEYQDISIDCNGLGALLPKGLNFNELCEK